MGKNYTKIAQKQIRNAQNATQDYVDGIDGVDSAPGQAAVKKKDKLRNNFNAAIDSGKWANNTAAVSLDEWKKAAKEKGGERFGPGVAKAADDIIAFHEDFGPKRDRLQAEIDAMPDATPEQREQKMLANKRGMAKLKRGPRRR